ncbi:unnamed protein product [Prunus armeniaca]
MVIRGGGATLARESNKAQKEYARRTQVGLEALLIGPGYQTPKSPKLGYSTTTLNEEEERWDNINSIGSVTLPLSLGTAPQRTTMYTSFLIVECPYAYNVILGRVINKNSRESHAVASKQKGKGKMEMYAIEQNGTDCGVELNPREGTTKKQAMPGGDLEKVQIDDNHQDWIIKIGS